MSDKATGYGNQAAPVKLTEEEKLRIVVRLLFHQGKVNLDGFDPGTGQSKITIQRMLDRLKKQYVTNAPDAPVVSAESASPSPKKRGRHPKDASDDANGPTAKKQRGRPKKIVTNGMIVKDEQEDLEAVAATVAEA